MYQTLILALRRQKGRSLLAGGGFFLVACTLILLTATTQSTVIQANQIISQNWRPTYDLVVLPPQAQIPPGKSVPSDYLEGLGGGISIEQYQHIQQIPGVAVAAPIAYLGYVPGPTQYIGFSPNQLPAGYYRIDWKLTEANGKHSIVEQQQSFMYEVPSCDQFNNPGYQQEVSSLYKTLLTQHIDIAYGCNGAASSGPTFFTTIHTGPFLLAAIDPTEESQLVHLDRHVSSGHMLTSQDTVQLQSAPAPTKFLKTYQVPVMIQQQMPGQVNLFATFSKVTTQQIDLRQMLARGGFNYLAHLPGQQKLFSHSVPTIQDTLPQIPQAAGSPDLYWDGHSWQPAFDSVGDSNLTLLYRASGLTYQPATPPAGQSGAAYTLVPAQGQSGPETAFRTLTPVHPAQEQQSPHTTIQYQAQYVGQFNSTGLAAQFSNPLDWLPETSYVASPVQFRYDALGRPVSPTDLLPTTNPTAFLQQPPLMLTTLAAAQSLLGNNVISVIRVRVSGVSNANEASWNHAAQVAQQIRQQTGLRVLVTLGSSPQSTLVYVPGVKAGQNGATQNIAPLGWVQERWIYVGVAILYLAQLGTTRLLFIGAILLVCLGYLIVTFNALVASQRREFALLSALGWRPWQPIQYFLGQTLLLAIGGGIVGIGVSLLIAALVGATPIWLVVFWTLPAVLILALLSALYPLALIWRIRPADGLRAGATISPARGRGTRRLQFWTFLPAVSALSLRNLTRQRLRVLIAAGSIFFSTLLLAVMFSGLLAFQQVLHGTLLGNYILFQTQLPQIAGAVFVVILTFLSVADLLLLQVRERQQEIGLLQAVGWRPSLLQQLFLQEGVMLALTGAIPGAILSWWLLTMLHIAQGAIPIPLIAVGALLLMLIVGGLATLPAIRAANHLPVVEVLRAE